MNESASLKSVPGLEALTSAEAAVFEPKLTERRYEPGAKCAAGEMLLIVRDGVMRLGVEHASERRELGAIGPGDLLGELELFVRRPAALVAVAQSEATCLVGDRRTLQSAFRYGRTAAVKLMGVFARCLARKIRLANPLLEPHAPADGAVGGEAGAFRLGGLDLERLRAFTTARTYPEGATIFLEGDPGVELFIIESGDVEILKRAGSGESLTLARLGAGDFFGEMAFVDARRRSATAVARSGVMVHVLRQESLERVLNYNVGTALYLTSVVCKIMARRLHATLEQILSLSHEGGGGAES